MSLKISVVMVCHNSAKTIGYSLESFFNQSHIDKEIVIVDGGSTDETLRIIRSFPQNDMTLVSERDHGIYDAMNKGLDLFRGEAVGFLNSDDCFYDGGVLAGIAEGLNVSEIVFGNIDFVVDHVSSRVVRKWRGTPFERGAFRRGWMPAHPSLYVQRCVVDAVGKFNPSFEMAADYEWMLRAFELQDFRTRFLNREIVKMQRGGASTSGALAYIRGNVRSLQARRAHFGTGIIDFAFFAKPLRKLRQFATARIFC